MPQQLHRAFSQLDITKQDRVVLIPAILGFTLNGVHVVDVPTRPGYVYARMRSNANEVVQVFNDKVSPIYDLPVLLIRDPSNPTRYRVDGRDVGRYENWGSTSSYLPKHGNQHSFNPSGGGDITWVYSQQIVPWLVSPSGTYGSDGVIVHGHPYHANEGWRYFGGTGTASLLDYKPTGTFSRMVLVSFDSVGNPQLTPGTMISSTITGSYSLIPYIPDAPGGSIPLAGVLLQSGTSAVTWDEIIDLRPLFSGVTTGSVSPVSDLDDLTDVTLTAPLISGSSLRYNGSQWINASGSSVVGALDDLSDVVISSAVSGSYLRYNGTNWINISGSAGGGAGALDDLSDVTITSLTSGSSLQYSGTQWINRLQPRFREGAIFGHLFDDYLQINGYGEMSLYGQALRWERESLPFTAGHVGSSAPTWATITGSFAGYQFGANNNMIFYFDLPLAWMTFDPATVYISWETAAPETSLKWVKWQVEYKAANKNTRQRYGAVVAGTLAAETSIPSGTSTNAAMYTEVGSIDLSSNSNIGTTIQLVVTRVASVSGSAPALDPFGIMVGIQYRLNSMGAFSTTQKTVSG